MMFYKRKEKEEEGEPGTFVVPVTELGVSISAGLPPVRRTKQKSTSATSEVNARLLRRIPPPPKFP